MVALSSMSSRGAALARTFASAFLALAEHAKTFPNEVDQIATAVAAHLKSWKPMLISVRPKDHRRPPRCCSRHAGLRHTYESMLPRIVVLSDDLWTALEVARHQIATYATRLSEARQ